MWSGRKRDQKMWSGSYCREGEGSKAEMDRDIVESRDQKKMRGLIDIVEKVRETVIWYELVIEMKESPSETWNEGQCGG
jgi:hypothetical protein